MHRPPADLADDEHEQLGVCSGIAVDVEDASHVMQDALFLLWGGRRVSASSSMDGGRQAAALWSPCLITSRVARCEARRA